MTIRAAGDASVLTTVNAPYRRSIDGDTLAECLRSGDTAGWIVHVATLFVDVRPGLVIRFARQHGIDLARLAQTYRETRDGTGERSHAFEAAVVDVGSAPGADVPGPGAPG